MAGACLFRSLDGMWRHNLEDSIRDEPFRPEAAESDAALPAPEAGWDIRTCTPGAAYGRYRPHAAAVRIGRSMEGQPEERRSRDRI